MLDREDLDLLGNVLSLHNTDVDLNFLYKVLTATKDYPELKDSLFDSFSSNQFASKTALINAVNNHVAIDRDSTVVIWGSWYGSILVPMLANQVKKIICIDLDNEPLQIAKNRLFPNYKNVEYICDDVFKTYRDMYLDTNLIINTSCEHMLPMKEWTWFQKGALETDSLLKHKFKSPKLSNNCYFALQSNNMFGIEGHINCVNNIDEFKEQLPERAEVLYQEEVEDTRGTRYMLVGKFMPL